MFWKKILILNIVIMYIALKLFLLISSQLKKQNKTNNNVFNAVSGFGTRNFSNIQCNVSNIFEINEELIKKFDKLRVIIYYDKYSLHCFSKYLK
jgi:hypothetical protein